MEPGFLAQLPVVDILAGGSGGGGSYQGNKGSGNDPAVSPVKDLMGVEQVRVPLQLVVEEEL